VKSQRSEIDQHVERAFDLLCHYRGFVCKPDYLDDSEASPVPQDLEAVLREWLPMAADADCKLIRDVLAAVGDDEAAAKLLRHANLHEERHACIDRLACDAILLHEDTTPAIARCQLEIANWKDLLPFISTDFKGRRHVTLSDKLAGSASGTYWSCDLSSRPSRIGASLFLARACESVARAAARDGATKHELRPINMLAHRLRQNPDWARFTAEKIAPVVDEQTQLVDEVELLLRELSLPTSQGEMLRNPLTTKCRQLHSAVRDLAGDLSNIRSLIDRYDQESDGIRSMEHLLRDLDSDPDPASPERAKTWRRTIISLRQHVGNANDLWESRIDGTDEHVRTEFTARSPGPATCGHVSRNSYHELFISLGRVILDPFEVDVIADNELMASASALSPGPRDELCRTYRTQILRELATATWWTNATQRIDLELNRVIVEMRTQPVVARPKTAVEWTPSAHQELVLKVLKRDGRMRTGLLWERVVPKHVDKRAHQNQMRDLVGHDRVLTTGKAQATEYWLP
jgi:hypothetical protein